jgi:hypothetical protein
MICFNISYLVILSFDFEECLSSEVKTLKLKNNQNQEISFLPCFPLLMKRLNEYSRVFLSKGYLQGDLTPEARILQIAETAQKILKKP